MTNHCRFFLTTLIVAFLISFFPQPTAGRQLAQDVPPDFLPVATAKGVALYKKDYPGGKPDYVQIVDLSLGASIELLHGPIADPGEGQGVYGGNSPRFGRETLQQAWGGFSNAFGNAFCITNGQFFSTKEDPTPLAFPLKIDGEIVSDGYGIDEFTDQKLMLEVWEDRAEITPLSEEALVNSSAPDIIAGLTEDANKNPDDDTGRTFVGIADQDSDGIKETILVFNSKTAKQSHAASIIRDFGAFQVLMLDGGGSTQLICQDNTYISSQRTIPQTLAVTYGALPTFSARVVRKPIWPILIVGDTLAVELEIENSGSEIWKAGEVQLVNEQNRWGAASTQPLSEDIVPGETAFFSWTSDPFRTPGVFSAQWRLEYGDQGFEDGLVQFSVIVLPKELEDKKNELEDKIRQWIEEQAADIEQRILEWIEQQINKGIQDICSAPLAFPVIALVSLGMRKRPGKKP